MGIMRKVAVLTTAVVIGVLSLTAVAWACVAGPTLLAGPRNVGAGHEVQISGNSYDEGLPVTVRFGALDGPVLGEFAVDEDGRLEGSVTVPAGTPPGNFVLISTQPAADGQPALLPSRALVRVVDRGGAPAPAEPVAEPVGRSTTMAGTEPTGTGLLLLAGVGMAGLVLFVAGISVLAGERSRPTPEVARTR